MSGVTVRYQVKFRDEAPKVDLEATPPPPTRAARMLALAHHVERLIDRGKLKDYAEAARMLGVSRARIAQVLNLLVLSPEIQEEILLGALDVSERGLRETLTKPVWAEQAAVGSPNRS